MAGHDHELPKEQEKTIYVYDMGSKEASSTRKGWGSAAAFLGGRKAAAGGARSKAVAAAAARNSVSSLLTAAPSTKREERRSSVDSHHLETVGSVASLLRVKVLVTDMPEFMQVHAFRCARTTYDSFVNFSSKQMAYHIKKEFDKVYGPAWHCIVGSSFGSYVTHSTGYFVYFSIEKLYILVFRTKLQRVDDLH